MRFSGLVFALNKHIMPNNKALDCSWIRWLITIFKHSVVIQLTQSLISCQLSQHQVRLHIDWVNVEWDSTSTKSTRNDEIFVNVGAFCINLVDMESHSALTQLKGSLTPPVCGRWIKPKQAYITSSGAFKGIGFRKINHECSNGANINQKMLEVFM